MFVHILPLKALINQSKYKEKLTPNGDSQYFFITANTLFTLFMHYI